MDRKRLLKQKYKLREGNNENLLTEVKKAASIRTDVNLETHKQPNTNSGDTDQTQNNLKTVLGSTYALGLGLDKGINDYSEDEDSENEETSENQDEKKDNLYSQGGKRKGVSQKRKIFSKKYNKKTKIKKKKFKVKIIKENFEKKFQENCNSL